MKEIWPVFMIIGFIIGGFLIGYGVRGFVENADQQSHTQDTFSHHGGFLVNINRPQNKGVQQRGFYMTDIEDHELGQAIADIVREIRKPTKDLEVDKGLMTAVLATQNYIYKLREAKMLGPDEVI